MLRVASAFFRNLVVRRHLVWNFVVRDLKGRYIGKKRGVLKDLMADISRVPPEEKPAFGQAVNALKAELEQGIDAAMERVKGGRKALPEFDVTLPGLGFHRGHVHPIAPHTVKAKTKLWPIAGASATGCLPHQAIRTQASAEATHVANSTPPGSIPHADNTAGWTNRM